MNWRSFFSFQGRVSRARFWEIFALTSILLAAIGFMRGISPLIAAALLLLLVIATVVVISHNVRRLHDMGRSGFWLLAIPAVDLAAYGAERLAGANPVTHWGPGAVCLGFFLWLGVMKGQPGPNRFGEPPPRWKLEKTPQAPAE